jgi:glutathione S-transferase
MRCKKLVLMCDLFVMTGNFNENHPPFVMAMLIVGVEYPLTATVLGVGWSISRLLYALGYTRADKENGKGRLIGLSFWLFQLTAFGLAGWCGVKMLFTGR